MDLKRAANRGFIILSFGVACLAQPSGVLAARDAIGLEGAPSSPILLATQSLDARPKPSATSRAGGAPRSTGREQSMTAAGARGSKPVHTTAAAGLERPGYVHYFLLTLPDESLETLVGIELPGRKIAWSFPGLGVSVSPFVEQGVVLAKGNKYEISHLYGIRPFPDDAAMNAFRGELATRVGRWVAAGTPYCDNDGPRSNCMSCLGFVLRLLFPGRRSDFPDLPGDFWRAMHEKSYSTEDLLLYLTGMLDLPTREARVKRIEQLTLPDALREDVQELVNAMEASGAVPPTGVAAGAPQRPVSRPANVTTRPAQRKRI